jgi:hypothetical protein
MAAGAAAARVARAFSLIELTSVSDVTAQAGTWPRTRLLVSCMFPKLAFAAQILGISLWCGAATSGYATDAPAPAVATVSASRTYIQRGFPVGRH